MVSPLSIVAGALSARRCSCQGDKRRRSRWVVLRRVARGLIILAVGSDYFSYCFNLHIDDSVDLVAVELSVNDEGIPEHVDNMENLIRGLSALPRRPAIVLVEAMAFSNGGMAGGGGRMHL